MNLEQCNAIYIAGPMRGLPYFNFIKFKRIEFWLKRSYPHLIVYNPVNIDIGKYGLDVFIASENGKIEDLEKFGIPFDIKSTIIEDLSIIIEKCDSIFMLQGWENSSGAKLELKAAKTFNYKVIFETDYIYKIEEFYKE